MPNNVTRMMLFQRDYGIRTWPLIQATPPCGELKTRAPRATARVAPTILRSYPTQGNREGAAGGQGNPVMLSVAKHLDALPDRPFAMLRVTREPCHAEGNEAPRLPSRQALRCGSG